MNLEKSFRIYQDRFADASDFTFFFVGNFEPATIRPLAVTYLGSLPKLDRNESWRDVGIRPPKGVLQKEVRKGMEPKSRVAIVFTGDYQWNLENNYRIQSMARAFQIKLREILREDLGGTYSIAVRTSTSRYPDEAYSLNISFGCAPERVDELTATVFQQVDSLRSYGIDASYLEKVKEANRRQRETDLKENRFWLNSLQHAYYHGRDPESILAYDKLVESLTLNDIRMAAHLYFNPNNYVQVVLKPETDGPAGSY
jgi:zinc protease